MKSRRITTLCISLAVLFMLLTACGTPAAGNGSASGSAAGSVVESEADVPQNTGWILTEQTGSAGLPKDAQDAFDKAPKKKLMGTLEPVALLGQQVVSGMNYAILCKYTQNEDVGLRVLTIYQNTEGTAKITRNIPFHVVDFADEQMSAPMEEILAGGWTTPETYEAGHLSDQAKAAFDKAAEKGRGESLRPVAELASRLEDGKTLYALLCSEKATGDPSLTVLNVVIIQENTDGTAELKSVCAIDPNPEMIKEQEAIDRENDPDYKDD